MADGHGHRSPKRPWVGFPRAEAFDVLILRTKSRPSRDHSMTPRHPGHVMGSSLRHTRRVGVPASHGAPHFLPYAAPRGGSWDGRVETGPGRGGGGAAAGRVHQWDGRGFPIRSHDRGGAKRERRGRSRPFVLGVRGRRGPRTLRRCAAAPRRRPRSPSWPPPPNSPTTGAPITGGGSWITNKQSGYCLGRSPAGWEFDNALTTPAHWHYGRAVTGLDMCGRAMPGSMAAPVRTVSDSCSDATKDTRAAAPARPWVNRRLAARPALNPRPGKELWPTGREPVDRAVALASLCRRSPS